MKDQAATLRDRPTAPGAGAELSAVQDTPTLILGSGKGGVGKSVASVGLAATLAAAGLRVLLVDGDQNLGNLHVLLGVRPALTPQAILADDADPAELPLQITDRLWLIPADSGADVLYGLGRTDRARLHGRLSALYPDFDLVIVDAGAGLDSAVRCAAMGATRLLILTMPEPTALTDAYALIKIVHGEIPTLPMDVVVNRTRALGEGESAFDRLQEAAGRFLARRLNYLGALPEDPNLRDVVREPKRLLSPLSAGPAFAGLHAIATANLLPLAHAARAPVRQ